MRWSEELVQYRYVYTLPTKEREREREVEMLRVNSQVQIACGARPYLLGRPHRQECFGTVALPETF